MSALEKKVGWIREMGENLQEQFGGNRQQRWCEV